MICSHSTKHIIDLWHIVVFFCLQFHIYVLNILKRLHEKKTKGLFRLLIDATNSTKTQITNLRFANCIMMVTLSERRVMASISMVVLPDLTALKEQLRDGKRAGSRNASSYSNASVKDW